MSDDRLPMRFGEPTVGQAVLAEQGIAVPGGYPVEFFHLSPARFSHVPGCACCVPRAPAAEALRRLLLARARNQVAWFHSVAVLATPAGCAAVRAALVQDQLVAARFRIVG